MVQVFNLKPKFIILALFLCSIVDAAPIERRTLAPSNLINNSDANGNAKSNLNAKANVNANLSQGQNARVNGNANANIAKNQGANILNLGSPVKSSSPNGLDADVDLCNVAGVNGLINSNCKSSSPSLNTATKSDGDLLDVGLLGGHADKDSSDDSSLANVDVLDSDGSQDEIKAPSSSAPLQTIKGSGPFISDKGHHGKQSGKTGHGSKKHPSAHPKPASGLNKGDQFVHQGQSHHTAPAPIQSSKDITNTFVDCSTKGGLLGLGGVNINSCNGGNGGNSLAGGSSNKNKGGLLPGILRRASPFTSSRFLYQEVDRRDHPHPSQHPHAHPDQSKVQDDAGTPTNVQSRRDVQDHPHPAPDHPHPKQHPHPAPSHLKAQSTHLARREELVGHPHPHPHPNPVKDENSSGQDVDRRNVDAHPHAHPHGHPQAKSNSSKHADDKDDELKPLESRTAHGHAHPQTHPHAHPQAHPHTSITHRELSPDEDEAESAPFEESQLDRRGENKVHPHPHPHPQAGSVKREAFLLRRDAVPHASAEESSQSATQKTDGDKAEVSEQFEKKDLLGNEEDDYSLVPIAVQQPIDFVYRSNNFSKDETKKRAQDPMSQYEEGAKVTDDENNKAKEETEDGESQAEKDFDSAKMV